MAIIPVQRASMAAIVGALQFNYIWEGEVDNYSLGGGGGGSIGLGSGLG